MYADWHTVYSPKKLTNKFVCLFLGSIYSAPICLRFYVTINNKQEISNSCYLETLLAIMQHCLCNVGHILHEMMHALGFLFKTAIFHSIKL